MFSTVCSQLAKLGTLCQRLLFLQMKIKFKHGFLLLALFLVYLDFYITYGFSIASKFIFP